MIFNWPSYKKSNGLFPLTLNIQTTFYRSSTYKYICKTSICILLLSFVLQLNNSNIDELSFMDNCLLYIPSIGFFCIYIFIHINIHTDTNLFSFLYPVNTMGTYMLLKGKFMPYLNVRNDHWNVHSSYLIDCMRKHKWTSACVLLKLIEWKHECLEKEKDKLQRFFSLADTRFKAIIWAELMILTGTCIDMFHIVTMS